MKILNKVKAKKDEKMHWGDIYIFLKYRVIG